MSKTHSRLHRFATTLCSRCLLLLGVLAGAGGEGLAEATAQEPVCPPPQKSARVKDAFKAEAERPDRAAKTLAKSSKTVKLGETIVVRIDSLSHLLQEKECAEKDGRARGLVLFLDDQPLTDVTPYPPTDPSQSELRFPLRRTEVSRDVWTRILGKPSWDARPTKVSLGLDDSYAIPSVATVQLEVLPRGRLIFWFLVLILMVIAFFIMARKSAMLRDSVTSPGAKDSAYSLARVQAAWWFFCILASYLLIGMVTGDFATSITGTTLVLLGISAGTAVGAAIVDSSKATPDREAQREAMDKEVAAELEVLEPLEAKAKAAAVRVPENDGLKNTAASVKAVVETKKAELRDVRNESTNFLQDILSDADGVNFHRFQMAAWTLILSLVFIGHVYRELAMPQFSETLLALLGISAGTYVGLKIPERTLRKEA